jgi:AcrR family transcriptional regulator
MTHMSATSLPPSANAGERPGLRERKKAQTRADIRRHGLLLFIEQGFTETSVEQIAAAANVSPSTVFRYFPTKESIVLADVRETGIADAVRAQPGELTPIEAVRAAVQVAFGSFSAAEQDVDQIRQELVLSVPELAAATLNQVRGTIDALAAALAGRSDAPAVDIRLFAGAVVGILLAADTGEETSSGNYLERVNGGLDRLGTGFALTGDS